MKDSISSVKVYADVEAVLDTDMIEADEAAGTYKRLLEKYMQFVLDMEGTDFVVLGPEHYKSEVKFTAEEYEALTQISLSNNT